MTPRDRVAAVYAGKTPDQVPLLLDLSHWYKKNYGVPFDLAGFQQVERDLVALHREIGAVCYCEAGAFYELSVEGDDARVSAKTTDGVFSTTIETPLGTIHEERVFERSSYSYNIRKHLLEGVEDFPIVEYLMERLVCRPRWDKYRAWSEALGECGYLYAQLPYSGSGYLISRNLGVEKTIYALADHPDEVRRFVDTVNACNLRVLDAIIDGPFDVLIISDNYDSNVQTKPFFDEYVRGYYTEVARRLHEHGKYLAVHVDGENRGVLAWLDECGVDCADAITPAPMFALTPEEIRAQAGKRLILSGGIPATEFGSRASDAAFEASVRSWLDLRASSPRLIMAAGDQVPPDASIERIRRLPELVDRYGRY
jgi:hypothetical protein